MYRQERVIHLMRKLKIVRRGTACSSETSNRDTNENTEPQSLRCTHLPRKNLTGSNDQRGGC